MADSDQNILHRYRTYSYHHVLIACDSTQTADALSSSDNVLDFQHPRDDYKYAVKQSKAGKYIVIVDGTTDASIYIEKVNIQNVVINNEMTSDGRQKISAGNLQAQMTLVEANGAIFLNSLANACHSLGVSPTSVFFLIKTIFIGYIDDGTIEPITNISPFIGTLLDSNAEFSNVGATYEIVFAGAANGAGNMSQFSGVAGAIPIGSETTTPTGEQNGSLGAALNAIIMHANTSNSKVMKEIIDNSDDPDHTSNVLRTVIFELDLDEAYANSKYRVVAATERLQTDTSDLYITTNGCSDLMTILQNVLEQSPQVLEDAQDKAPIRYRPTIRSKVESISVNNIGTTDQPTETTGLKITYTIRRVLMPKAQRLPGTDLQSTLPGVDSNNILNLKYIFTGKNVDILDFNMHMQFGTSFLMNLVAQSSIPIPGKDTSSVANILPAGSNSSRPTEQDTKQRENINAAGVFSSNPIIRNSRDPLLTSKFYAAMSQHAQVEVIQTTIKIHGNPRFLNNEGAGGPFEYVTIDIKMPDPNDPNVLIDFWFRGFYRVLTYNNTFESGVFTQTLDLTCVPYDTAPITESASSSQSVNIPKVSFEDLSKAIDNETPNPNSSYKPPVPSPKDKIPDSNLLPLPPGQERNTNIPADRKSVTSYMNNRNK